MKLQITTKLALWIVGIAVLGYAQSLGELAKKEKERREKMKAESKVITNDDAAKYANGPITTVKPPVLPDEQKADAAKPPAETGKPPGAETGKAPAAAQANPNEPTDLQGRPESFWRQTFADARQKVKELEDKENVLVLKVNDLQNRFFRTDDGFQRQALQAELQKTFIERDQTAAELKKAKDQLDDLEKEARKSGALPGWMSGKP